MWRVAAIGTTGPGPGRFTIVCGGRTVPQAQSARGRSLRRGVHLCYSRIMSVDADTVRRIAHLARVKVGEDEIAHLQGELNAILAFVEQLEAVNVDGVEPMTSVTPMEMKKRADVVNDGGDLEAVLKNAPAREGNYFAVPKVVE